MTVLSMNEVTTLRWSLQEDLDQFQEAGYRGIAVWRPKMADENEVRAVELLTASGMEITNLSWAGGFTGSDGRTLEDSIDDALDAVRLAAAMNAGCLTLYAGGRNNHTQRHANRLFLTAIDELLPFAEAADVPLAIEPMHAASAVEWTFYTSLESVLDVIERYDSPHLKLAIDTYHFQVESFSRVLWDRIIPHLAIVHLSDRRSNQNNEQVRCSLGCGRLPLKKAMAALATAGYGGPIDIKLVGAGDETRNYWALLEESLAFFTQLAAPTATRTLA